MKNIMTEYITYVSLRACGFLRARQSVQKCGRIDCLASLAMTLALFFLFIPSSFTAQTVSQVEVSAKVLKNKIKIGDEIRFWVKVDRPRKYSVLPFSEKMNLAPFEIKKINVAPIRKGQNRVQEIFGFTLTVFEIGDLKIPPVLVRYQDASGKPGEILTEPVPVIVVSVGKKLTDKDDVRPIKGPVSISLLRFRTWILSILAALLTIFLVTKIIIRWRKRNKDLESRKPPHIRVKIELERLKNQGLLEEKKLKEYYSGLADILKNYMDRVWKLQTHEHTTVEVLELLAEKNLEKNIIDKIKTVLEETDLVKFANVIPAPTLSDQLEKEIWEVVELTKPNEKETAKS